MCKTPERAQNSFALHTQKPRQYFQIIRFMKTNSYFCFFGKMYYEMRFFYLGSELVYFGTHVCGCGGGDGSDMDKI